MSRYPYQQNQEFGRGDRYDRLTNYNNARSQSSAYRPSDNLYDEHYGKRGATQERPNDRRRMGGGGVSRQKKR